MRLRANVLLPLTACTPAFAQNLKSFLHIRGSGVPTGVPTGVPGFRQGYRRSIVSAIAVSLRLHANVLLPLAAYTPAFAQNLRSLLLIRGSGVPAGVPTGVPEFYGSIVAVSMRFHVVDT